VQAASGTHVVVEVGGVGLDVVVTPAHAAALRVGAQALLRTVLVVREDDLTLYGFRDAEERSVFDLLRGVTGVGPKSAMGVLAAMEPEEVARAVAAEDDGAFRKVSGIGPKTAKLNVLSLAGKMHAAAPVAAPAGDVSIGQSVLAALVGLGWPERVAAGAVDDALAAARDGDGSVTVPALLRLALGRLGSGSARSGGSAATTGARSR
jgi:Holliday junction DNA helicase RuvA